ncbi:MAG: glycosyltransferase family 4 protein [Bacteroidota bacterium]|nr:glycosyltransferase family 4 protein [Bacteroidota bacterium]
MKLRVLIIGSVWPEPQSSAAGSRTRQLISLFRSKGWEITFASAAAESEYMIDLEKAGVSKKNIQINDSSFDDFIIELKPEIVMFDRFIIEEQFGWRVAENCPDALRILDTIDLHCLRQARHTALKEKRSLQVSDLFSDIAKREIASITRSDLSFIISDAEMKFLEDVFKVDKQLLHYLPFMPEAITDSEMKQWKPFEERLHFVTIGNFLHAPNLDAAIYLKKEIWPLIRKRLPEAELHVYGAYPSQKVLELNDEKNGFFIKGRAVSSSEVMSQGRVCLAPLRFGAGIKGKLVEAMQCGTPSVTTEIGAESMHGHYDWSGIISNEPSDIAEAAIKLHADKSLWEQAQQNGRRIINEFFAKEAVESGLLARMESVMLNLKEHRMENFTGAMLLHQTMAGTKYMSRWIEAKNKNINQEKQ